MIIVLWTVAAQVTEISEWMCSVVESMSINNKNFKQQLKNSQWILCPQ